MKTTDNGTAKKKKIVALTVRVPEELYARLNRFIRLEQEGRPNLHNWFINKWISDGLKKEGDGY